MKYQFSLKNFQGPLDLLLHLISKAKIEPKDIFVSEITEQYLAYMSAADELDLDSASEFLQMAAELLYIKSRSLLPRRRLETEEDGLTPEERLIARLNEYKRYKEAAEKLMGLEEAAENVLYKLPEELLTQEETFENEDERALMIAFAKLLEKTAERKEEKPSVTIQKDHYSIHRQAEYILARLSIAKRLSFEEIMGDDLSRPCISATFVAMLELLHQGKVRVTQRKTFGTIILETKEQSHG